MFRISSVSRRRSLAVVLVVAVCAALGIGASSASAAPTVGTASISGTVYGPDSVTPLANVSVDLYLPGGSPVQFGSTDADGTYTFTGLAPASYLLDFQPNFGDPYAPQWWNNQPTMATATPIPVAAGANVTGLQTTLGAGATVAGTVDGAGDSAVFIDILDSAGNSIAETSTFGSGDYSITGVPAGSFTAEFSLQNNTGDQSQWWNDESSQAGADYFTTTAGETTAGIDATFGSSAPGTASISGTVYAPGLPAAGAQLENVSVENADGSIAGSTTTAMDGTYTIGDLGAGSYTLQFSSAVPDSTSASQWWNAESSFASADFFTVSDGQVLTGYDAQLVTGGTISGTVLDGTAENAPMANAFVEVYQDGAPVDGASTDDNGNFSITGLSPGEYDVQFEAAYPSNDVTQWWQDAASEATATSVIVAAGSTASGIDATLQAGGAISGTVSGRAANGSVFAVGNAQVQVFNSDGSLFTDSDLVGDDGTYSITNMPAGSYTIYFAPQPDTTDFVPQWWKNKSTEATATPIVIKAGQTKSNINPVLASTTLKVSRPKISGKLKVGSTLTAKPGSWGPGTVSLGYSWARNGVAIDGATSSTYLLSNHDANATMTVTVTGSESGYTTDSVTSPGRGPVTGGVLSVGVPTIEGVATEGQTLTADPGAWGPGTVALTYKWYRGANRIDGATASTYTLGHADVGKTVTVRVTGAEAGFTTAVVASAPTGVVN